jgi:hypothetical protein
MKSRYLKVSAIAIFIILILNYAIGIIFLNFGNPIRLLICKYKLEKYSKAVYGENAMLYELPKYNLKDGEYHC